MPRSKRSRAALSLLLLLPLPVFASAQAFAPTASPALTARIAGVNSEAAESRKLRIDTLDVRVRIHGTIAETTITARFGNTGQQNLEGDFTLTMPAGSVVTGYALDVNGQMIEGVLVDQRQGRLAYETLVRGRIDPGLAEVSRDNLFRTRVFPILPGSGRTIRLQFTTPLDPREGYVLPFHDTDEIGAFSLEIEAAGMARPPLLRVPGEGAPRWVERDGAQHFSLRRRDARLDGAIAIEPPEPGGTMLVSRHANGERFFQIHDAAAGSSAAAPPARAVTILWDRSLSRADDDLDAEIALLRRYLERVRPAAIDLILFDSGGAERTRARDVADLVRRLRGVRYRGATSLAVLANARLTGADSCLLFSDGLVTIDRREGFEPDCPLFVLSSARDADRFYLGSLARNSGGEAYDLNVRAADEVLARMTRRVPRVTDVRATGGARIDYTLLDGGESGWRIVGPMPASGDIVVRLSGLPSGGAERIYSPRGAPAEMNGAGALWAADRAALLAASDERSRDALVSFSRHYSVASPDVSFIVLETGRDYAASRIEPPADLPAAWLDEYRRVRDQMKEQETAGHGQRLETVVGQWREMREWWATRFVPVRRPKPGDRDVAMPVVETPMLPPQSQPLPIAPPPPPPAPPANAPAIAEESTDAEIIITGGRIRGNAAGADSPVAVTVSGGRGSRADRAGQASRGTIAIEPWTPSRPYLAALEAAAPADLDRVFAEQQREHGALPAFWLDVADRAYRRGRRAEAIALVLSALDLPTRNNQTLAIVADRLLRYGQIDRAIWLYERLLAAEDDRPQPRRTLALALARRAQGAPPAQARADLARALSLLTEVVMTPWEGAYQGIEMIALMEANRLIPRYRALGGAQIGLDPRLIALLDVDLRVVIEWQTEASDVDLWVDEPGGERAIFHNPRTAIGGRLSNDMTQGYGPEEYLLRRAPAGAYDVRANVFSADRLNPNGAQRVTARIIRDYGRATEREEIVDIELLPDDATRERRIGTVTFAASPRGRGPARRPARDRGRRGSRR